MGRFYIVREFGQFIVQEKKWWLIPLIAILLMVGLIILTAESSPLGPLLYPLF